MSDPYFSTYNAITGEAQKSRQNMLAQQAGSALANGDSQGAVNALYRGGDIASGQQIQATTQANDVAQRRQHAEGAQKIAQGIRGLVQKGMDPQAAYAQALQYAPALGLDPGDLQKLKPYYDQNPAGFLDFMDQQAKHELEIVNRGEGGYDVVDKSTGGVVRGVPRTEKPIEMKPGSNYVVPDSTAGQGASPAPAAAPAAGADAVWQNMIQRESGGKPGVTGPQTPYGRAQGMSQMLPQTAQAMAQKLGVAWRPDLMTGTTPEAAAYQQQLGRAYFDEGLQKYGGDVNKAAAYYFAGPDEKLWGPKTQAYAQAVTAGSAPLQGGPGGDTLAPAGFRVIQRGTPKADENAAVDPNIVKGLIEGRITPPTQKAAATPYWQAQLQAATQADPTFDGVNFQARAKTRADFTSGKSAQNITALNTVIGHLDHLDRTIDGLGNYGSEIGPLSHVNNQLAHAIAGASGTDARVKNFETAKTAVANELTRVFRGTGGAEADIQKWMQQLDAASSPTSLHEVVRSMSELIKSRVEALGEQYQQGMGTTKDPITLLTPDKQKAFQRMMGGQSGQGGQAPRASGPTIIRYDAKGNRIP